MSRWLDVAPRFVESWETAPLLQARDSSSNCDHSPLWKRAARDKSMSLSTLPSPGRRWALGVNEEGRAASAAKVDQMITSLLHAGAPGLRSCTPRRSVDEARLSQAQEGREHEGAHRGDEDVRCCHDSPHDSLALLLTRRDGPEAGGHGGRARIPRARKA